MSELGQTQPLSLPANYSVGAPTQSRTAPLWTYVQQAFGYVFATSLVWGLLAFPVYKHNPIGYVPVVLGAGLAFAARRPAAVQWLARRLSTPGELRFTVILAVLAMGVRIVAVLVFGREPVSDHHTYNEAALSMLRGSGYPPSAYYPPGTAFWLFLVYTVFGESLRAAQLVNAGVGTLLSWLTYRVGRRVLSIPAARLAGLLVALFPGLVVYTPALGYDALLGCAVLGAVLLFQSRGAPRTHAWWYVAVIGVLVGGASFLKPIGLLLPLVFGLSYWRRGTSRLRAVRNTTILVIAMLATLSPWIWRNYWLFGEFVPVTTSGGAALWVSNNPRATGLTAALPEVPGAATEPQRDRALWHQAWDHIFQHPDRFARVGLAKLAYMWGTASTVLAFVSADQMNPTAEGAFKLLINLAWSALAFLFAWALVRCGLCRSAALFWPLVALLAYLWGIHLFYEAQCRYWLPLLPVICIGAAGAWLGNSNRVQGET